jgi:hypothetical protein
LYLNFGTNIIYEEDFLSGSEGRISDSDIPLPEQAINDIYRPDRWLDNLFWKNDNNSWYVKSERVFAFYEKILQNKLKRL